MACLTCIGILRMTEDFEDLFASVDEVPKRLSIDKKEKWGLKLFAKWTSTQGVPEVNLSHQFTALSVVPGFGTNFEIEPKDYHALLLESTYEELDETLSKFIIDINNQRTGKRLYSPETIRQLVMSLQRFLRSNGRHVSLLTDPNLHSTTELCSIRII